MTSCANALDLAARPDAAPTAASGARSWRERGDRAGRQAFAAVPEACTRYRCATCNGDDCERSGGESGVPPRSGDTLLHVPNEQTAEPTGVVRALLAGVQRAIAETEARLSDLRVEERGLMLTARRLGVPLDDVPPPLGNASVEEATVTSRSAVGPMFSGSGALAPGLGTGATRMTDLVEEVLRRAERPLSPKDIAERLTALGHPQENTEAVRGALAYLKRRKPPRARDIARSKWVLPGGSHDLDLVAGQSVHRLADATMTVATGEQADKPEQQALPPSDGPLGASTPAVGRHDQPAVDDVDQGQDASGRETTDQGASDVNP